MMFSIIDDTDFVSTEEALSIANTDIKLMKNGAAAVSKNSGGATHRYKGAYSVTFDATDTNTVGELYVSIAIAGTLVSEAKFWVYEEAVYDALFGSAATGKLPATIAVGDIANDAFAAAKFTTDYYTAIANSLEAAIVNDGDATALLAAIASACNAAIVAGQIGTDTAAVAEKLPSKPRLMGSDDADGGFDAEAKEDISGEAGDASEENQTTIISKLEAIHGDSPAITDNIKSLKAAVSEIVVGGGDGPRVVALKVTDGTNPIQNAIVRMYLNGENYRSTTGVDGVVDPVFGLVEDGSWSVVVAASNHSSLVTSLEVSEDIEEGDQIYELTANLLSGSVSPDRCEVGTYVEKNGLPLAGASFSAKLLGNNNLTANGAVTDFQFGITDGSGLASVEVIRLDQIVDGDGIYEFTVKDGKGNVFVSFESTVPNLSSAWLESLVP